MKHFIFFLSLLIATEAFAAKDYLSLSSELAKLRSQVEQLNEDVQEVRREYSSQLRAYSLQKAELEATARKEEIKKKQLLEKISRLKGQMKKEDRANGDLTPTVVQYIDKLATYIAGTMPYKKEDRLQNIETIKRELSGGEIRAHHALSRLWSAYEDEQRLTRENQVSKERIEVEGVKYLAEVAKLGSSALFYRLDNGQYGKAVQAGEEWIFQPFNDSEQTEAAKGLFDGLKKQIKAAEYVLPNGFQQKGVQQ